MVGVKGRGKIEYEDGSVYRGEFVGNKAHGSGTLKTVGYVYTGDFEEGNYHGKGTFRWTNGNVYEGEFVNGYRHGKGKLLFASGSVYEGEFENGRRHGKGKCTYASRDVYEGEFENGYKHGKGNYTYASGNVYEGNWKDGKKCGHGRMAYANGDVFEGIWKDGNMSGKGKYVYADGKVFEGNWEGGDRHGQGTLKDPSGHVSKKRVYSHGKCLYSKSFATLILDERPSQRRRTESLQEVAMLSDEHLICSICNDEFSFNMNTNDENIKQHLPVVGSCLHKCCHGCILKQQMAITESSGRVPKKVDCMECRKKGAFCPSEPKYHSMLIDLLENSIPVRQGGAVVNE